VARYVIFVFMLFGGERSEFSLCSLAIMEIVILAVKHKIAFV